MERVSVERCTLNHHRCLHTHRLYSRTYRLSCQSESQILDSNASGPASPDKVDTRLGTLKFFDGFPDKAIAEKLLDNLDFQRGTGVFLAIPAVSQVPDRNARLTLGPANKTIPIWEQLVDSRTIGLTFNDNTVYSWGWLNLKDGPLVVEVPPKVLGGVNDIWFRWVIDVGITGPDKGQGGQYLFLPPGYKGQVPEGYHVVHSPTYNLWIPWRSFLVNGDPKPGIELVKKFTKIYPLADKDKPAPPIKYVDVWVSPSTSSTLLITGSGNCSMK